MVILNFHSDKLLNSVWLKLFPLAGVLHDEQDSKTGLQCSIVDMRRAANYAGSGCNPPENFFTLILDHVPKAVVQLGLRILACRKNKLFRRRVFWWTRCHVPVASEKQDTSGLFKT